MPDIPQSTLQSCTQHDNLTEYEKNAAYHHQSTWRLLDTISQQRTEIERLQKAVTRAQACAEQWVEQRHQASTHHFQRMRLALEVARGWVIEDGELGNVSEAATSGRHAALDRALRDCQTKPWVKAVMETARILQSDVDKSSQVRARASGIMEALDWVSGGRDVPPLPVPDGLRPSDG